MARFFISHTAQDKLFAQNLKEELMRFGHDIWWFDDGIAPGERWQDSILKSLRDADALAIIVSQESKKSPWINHEVGAALTYSRERGKPLVVPILVDPSVSLPPPLDTIQAVFSDDPAEVAKQLVRALESQQSRLAARKEERKEVQERVEANAAEFIEGALTELQDKEGSYRRLAYTCYGIAYATLVGTTVFGAYRALDFDPAGASWESLAQLTISGVLIIVLLIGLAKYAFTLGKSFMVESLRNADRRHAIRFGEFYLKAYGSDANWQEVKEAFQHWNIDKGSSFLGQTSEDFDPQLISLIVEVVRAAGNRIPKEKKP